ncbi:MAG: hypothetical protein A2049_11200 [Elusimicrobia bacterium GWA2_62_23]|nr:MAG: hypothetical protein A2049_11200 [Elusimicrobia bacterium GWA2_62_23]
MNKRMIKTMKLGLALAAIFAAAPVRAEISIEMGVEGYVPGAYSRAAEVRAARLESLAAAAQALENSGDAAGSEVLLAGLYSGSVAAEKVVPVYVEPRAALPAVKEVKVKSVKSAIEEIGADAPTAGDAGSVAAEDADAGSEVSAGSDSDTEDEDKPTAGSMLLATLIVVALAFLLLYAPLLLVAI